MGEEDYDSKNSDIEVFMNPKTDFGFKKIFGYKEVLMPFLNALEVLPEEIVDVEYLPLEQLGIIKTNHKAVYDLYVKVPSGRRYIIEMQIAPHDNFIERLLLYASYSIVYQSTRGKSLITDEKNKTLKEIDYDIAGIYMIAILDFVLFKEPEVKNVIMEQVKLIRQNAGKEFTDKFRFLIIELAKFKKTLSESISLVDKILYTLTYIDKLAERPAEMDESILKLLYEAARVNKLSGEEMETYHQSVLDYHDVRLAVNHAKREGREEGIETGEKRGIEIGEKRGIEIGEKRGIEIGEKRGIEQERIRSVKTLYALNIDIDLIAKFTGFTEEQIRNILNNG
jgi:predicted transposase/invertase (TIGR01784 family)